MNKYLQIILPFIVFGFISFLLSSILMFFNVSYTILKIILILYIIIGIPFGGITTYIYVKTALKDRTESNIGKYDFKKWWKIHHEKGIIKYVVKWVFIGIIIGIFLIITETLILGYSINIKLTINLIIMIIFGIAFGLFFWNYNEKKFLKQ